MLSPDNRTHVYNQYMIRVLERDELAPDYLRGAGLPTEVYYPYPLHLQPAFAYLGYRQDDFPETERACREVLALARFPGVDRVAAAQDRSMRLQSSTSSREEN